MKLFILTLSIALISQLALAQKSTINVNYMDQRLKQQMTFFSSPTENG